MIRDIQYFVDEVRSTLPTVEAKSINEEEVFDQSQQQQPSSLSMEIIPEVKEQKEDVIRISSDIMDDDDGRYATQTDNQSPMIKDSDNYPLFTRKRPRNSRADSMFTYSMHIYGVGGDGDDNNHNKIMRLGDGSRNSVDVMGNYFSYIIQEFYSKRRRSYKILYSFEQINENVRE